jgi:hypothetical protein
MHIQNIVAKDEILGPALAQLFGNKIFLSHFNIQQMTPLDVLKALRKLLPRSFSK